MKRPQWIPALVLSICSLSSASDEVGELGEWSRIRVTGSQAFSAERILDALKQDVLLIGPRHPRADAGGWSNLLCRRIEAGYRFQGFPDVRVTGQLEGETGKRLLLLQVVEGPRFRAGRVVVGDTSALDTDQLQRVLLSRRDKTTNLPGDFLLPRDSHGPLWIANEPTRFDDAWRSQAISLLDHVHESEGIHGVEPELEFVRRDDGYVDLHVAMKGSPRSPTIQTIEILGAERNGADSVRAWLKTECGIDVGVPVRVGRIRQAQEKLRASGRFLVEQIRLDPAEKTKLIVQVIEHTNLPLLATPLSSRQQFFLKLRDWLLRRVVGGEEDLLIRSSKKITGGRYELCCSFTDGIIIEAAIGETDDRRFEATLLLDANGLTWMSTLRNQAVRIPGGRKNAVLVLSLATRPPDENGNCRIFNFGGGIQAGMVASNVSVEISPAAALLSATDPQEEKKTDDGIEITFTGNGVNFSANPDTGRLSRLEGPDWPVVISTAPGVFARRAREIATRIEKHGLAELGPSPFGRALGLIADDVLTALPEASLAPVGLDTARARQLVRAVGSGIVEPIEAAVARSGSDSEGEFRLPPEPVAPVNDPMALIGLAVAHAYLKAQDYWSVEDWPLRVIAETHAVISRETPHTRDTLRDLSQPGRMGPVGCLVVARLLKQVDVRSSMYFAQLGQKALDHDAFFDDLDVICKGAEKLGGIFAKIDRPEEIVLLFPEEHRAEVLGLITSTDQSPRAARTATHRITFLAWEPLLKPLLAAALQEAGE